MWGRYVQDGAGSSLVPFSVGQPHNMDEFHELVSAIGEKCNVDNMIGRGVPPLFAAQERSALALKLGVPWWAVVFIIPSLILEASLPY